MGFSAGDNRVTELVSRNPDIRRLFSADELRTLSYEEIKSLYNERVSSGSETTRNSRMSDLRSAIPAAQVPNAAPALVQPAPGPTPANNLASMGMKGPARPGVALPDPVAPKAGVSGALADLQGQGAVVRPTVPGNPTDLRNQQSSAELINTRMTQLKSRVGSTFASNMFTSGELTSMSDAQFNAAIDNRFPNAERFSFVPATELFTASELWTLSHADYKAQFTVRSNARLPLNPPPIGNPNNNGFDPRGGSDCNTNGLDDSIDLTPVTAADNCVDAQFVCAGRVYSGTTVGASTSTSNCTGTAAPDVWYKYRPSADGTLTLSFCTGGGSAAYDTSLGVFADCTTTVPLACNDDFCGLQSQVSVAVTSGTTYFLRVSGFSSNAGTYNLAVIGPASSCGGGSRDCDSNGTPDECDLAADPSRDCNSNGTLDQCESGFADCNNNGTTDLCEPGYADCNNNGTADSCEIAGNDCNSNGTLDACEGGGDCNQNGTPDNCDIAGGEPDCNSNGLPDSCDVGNNIIVDSALVGFVDISGTGTALNLGDDGMGDVTMPFTTSFFPNANVRISNNGAMGFNAPGFFLPFTNAPIPGAFFNNGQALYPHWDDLLTPPGNVFFQTINSSPNQVFIVQWHMENHFGGPAGDITFQVQIFETPISGRQAQYLYSDVSFDGGASDNGGSATIGYQETNTVGDQFSFNTQSITSGTVLSVIRAGSDCNSNGTLDECELVDCNSNGILDDCEPGAGDCNSNGTPDLCEGGFDDCNTNGTADACDPSLDCNSNGIPDECELTGGDSPVIQLPDAVNGFFSDPSCSFCGTGQQAIADNFSLSSGATISGVIVHGGYFTGNVPYTPDVFSVVIHDDSAGIPGTTLQTDSAAGSRVATGVTLFGVSEYRYVIPITSITLGAGTYWVEVTNGGAGADTWFWETGGAGMGTITNSAFATTVPGSGWFVNGGELSLELVTGAPTDCDGNGSLDECEIADGRSDCNSNGTLDACEPGGEGDCNSNGTVDACDTVVDCNTNDILDECDIAGGSNDCDSNGIPDECELVDCNTNGTLDSCDLAAGGGGNDCDTNGTLDECDEDDCNNNDIPDACDLAGGGEDCNTNGSIDSCEASGGESPINQPPNAVNGFFSDGSCSFCGSGQQAIADNFSLSSNTTISGVIVHGGYFTGNSPYNPDSFNVIIHSDGGGIPGGTLQTDTGIAGTRATTGVTLFGVSEYRYEIPFSPINLGAGTYWVEVTNEGAGADTWFWETGAAGMGTITNSAFATTVPGSGWFTNGGELSLEIITGLPTDCDGNGSLDVCELANGATDCNSNGILDRCEPGGEGDCNSNGTVDACDVVVDCNTNDVLDECDIAGDSDDCNLNGVPDECEFIDCNTNGTLDSCDVAGGGNDCNTNSIPDECETGAGGDATDTCENAPSICPGATYSGSTAGMAPTSGLPGVCGASDASPDVYYKYTPTADGSLTLSFCPADGGSVGYDSVLHVLTGCPATSSVGCNDDSCGLSSRLVVSVTAGTTYYVRVSGFAGSSGSYTLAVIGPDCFAPSDCNTNGTLDVCEIAADPSIDCDTDGVIDLCQPGGGDCNANGTTDRCEAGFADCNTDNTADFCQLDGNDCNTNGVPDECDPDCNTNAIPDECDILSGASQDCNTNSTPDECETSGGASPVSQPPNAVNGFFSDPTCSFCGTGQQAMSDNFSVSQSTSISAVIVHGGYFTSNTPYSPDDFSIVIHSDGGGVPGATIQTDSGVVGARVATGVILFGVDEYRYVLPITPILLAPGTYWVEVTNGGAGADTWFWETGAAGAGTITNSAFATTVPGSGWFANGGELSLDVVTGSPTDCNTNGSLDVCEIANGGSDCNTNNILDNCEPGGVGDCNSNGTPDACETVVIDCNTNLQLDECDISSGASQDCDSNGTPDECELIDCNTNGTLDSCDTLGGTGDCNTNGVPDECEGGCNTNGIPDECDILSGDSDDCNSNGTPDECEISGGGDATDSCANAPTICTGAVYSGSTVGMAPTAGLPGVCGASDGSPDVYYSYTAAADGSLTLSMCPADGGSTTYDTVLHVLTGCPATASVGCNDDSCGLSSRLVVGVTAGTTYSIRVSGFGGSSGSYSMAVLGPPCVVPNDCNTNGSIDTCEINDNPSIDCDSNGVIDDCEGGGADCNSNGTRDRCDPGYADCNNDGIADFCQLDANDCNANGTPDDCEADCNTNSIPDDCDIDSGASIDCNTNGVPDECDAAPVSGLSQPADAVNGYFSDPTCSFCGTGAQAIADNFSVGGPGSLEGVTFTGGYFSGNAPYNPDDFTVIIHSDSAGLPGAAVDTQMNVPGTRVDTGVILFGVNRYEYTLTLNPVSLAAGTYWIEITNGGAGADTWFWETGAISGGTIPNSAFATTVPGSGWFANGGEMSMTLLLGNPNDANGNGIPDECEAVCTCQGDTNGDNLLDGADVQGFTDCLISGTGCDCTDSDHDGTPANGDAADDLAAFVADLLSGATCPNP